MFSKYFLLIVGLVATVYIKTTNAYGVCSCMCCDGVDCDPRFVGTTQVSSCDGFNCINSCKNAFPIACDSAPSSEVSASCQEMTTTIISTASTSSSTESTMTTTGSSTTSTASQSTSTITTTATMSTSTTTDTSSTSSQSSTSTTTSSSSTTTHSGAFTLQESSLFITLLLSSLLLVTKTIF
ncbi:unnamed protein product [Adineta steineri]|uniref:Uncharacterized protein n=2 Tax=Adineta steineri TaxID=433720 RepID=A0A815ETH2_9BILA|nr:unnamed protein product [Adineta steineri]CAF3840944.1 unnamed protein product [Adineta steineri]